MGYEIGQRVGDYEIVQLLGIGGMGSVYRVRNVISDRTEAMKVLLPDLTAERDLAIRFISEIRTLASFDHPNIALLHTAFQADNQLIMMMEFVEGSTLEQRAKQGPMSIADVSGYTYQALSALSYAHGRGVVHRDIKPANIMLTSHGIVKLMDFGIAKSKVETNLTRPGTTIGSLYYMSPEQVRGDAVDGRSDLYSVGIMLYELLAGRRPFEADTTFSILNQQLNTPPQPPIELNPSLPRALNDLILHALAKDPNDRYQTADNFRDALRPFCTSQSSGAGHVATMVQQPVVESVSAAAITAVNAPPSVASAPPPFANVAMPPPPSQPVRPAGGYPTQQKSHKTLWVATGVAAAILAMVGLAIGLPHVLGTHAAESPQTEVAQSDSAGQPSGTTASQAGQQQAGQMQAASPTPAVLGGTSNGSISSPQPGGLSGAQAHLTPPSPPFGNAGPAKRQPYVAGSAGNTQSGDPGSDHLPVQPEVSAAHVGGSAAQLEEASNRYTEISARAGAVDTGLNRLRRQQEAEGYGLRGDMDSADNRMQSYLRAADQDLRASNAASAEKNLNRADAELATLEKFLGH
ncbi:serine/threonine-protein kinase [Granulicella arctica]|uniref:serine/threonine-protein kinase n=1 Tax=Granulicella arctica TaxID=940613 RepID=UPI0021DF984B|nr:serine/threonine-protein kinase [Granulicella arctica]